MTADYLSLNRDIDPLGWLLERCEEEDVRVLREAVIGSINLSPGYLDRAHAMLLLNPRGTPDRRDTLTPGRGPATCACQPLTPA